MFTLNYLKFGEIKYVRQDETSYRDPIADDDIPSPYYVYNRCQTADDSIRPDKRQQAA
ncbi:MAG TPA: hypothetical protein VMV86_05065 [Methanosarcinales archaeon]|nr:hypothetical protein [Methanosarcinales archaeon]